VVIKRPAGGEAARLVADVVDGMGAQADAAAARLAVLGTRAVPHVLTALAAAQDAEATARLIALLARLPASRDALAALAAALDNDADPVAAAAVDAWGALLASEDAALATRALDRLTAVALDAGRSDVVRTKAIAIVSACLGPLERSLLHDRLAADDSQHVRAATTVSPLPPAHDGNPFSRDASPELVRRHLAQAGATMTLPELHRLVVATREREAAEPESARQAEWLGARAAVHQVLADRGSTVALYDLREMLTRARGPIPVGALAALASIGDLTCLDAIADAYDGVSDAWSREQLAAALAAVAERHKLSRRSAAVKRLVDQEHPLAAALPSSRRKR
jgi:hypothetical protein